MHEKAFGITKSSKYEGYQKSLASSEQQLAKEWYKPIVRKFKKRKAHSTFINIIWGADFADMILIRKFNKRIVFFYYELLISRANIHGLFLYKIKKVLC